MNAEHCQFLRTLMLLMSEALGIVDARSCFMIVLYMQVPVEVKAASVRIMCRQCFADQALAPSMQASAELFMQPCDTGLLKCTACPKVMS